jgi:glycosyltransferase involved in cell wall biosynthesis
VGALTVDRPSVTFIVTCHNYGRYLRQALDSLVNQTLSDLEILVIDDASTDETPHVLEEYRGLPQVRIVSHSTNQGNIASYNAGLRLARGRYVGILSADDYALRADAAARQTAMFEADPRVGLVYSAHTVFDSVGVIRHVVPWSTDGRHPGLQEFRRLMWGNYILHSGALLRREVVDELGPYDPRLSHSGDWDMWLRAAARHDVGYIAEPLYAYRLHQTNMFHRGLPPWRETDQVLLTIERAFASLPGDAPRDLLGARPAVERHGLLQTPWFDLGNGRRKRTAQGLAYAVCRRPATMASGEFWRFLPRVILMSALGRAGYRRLAGRVDRWRGRTAPGVA